MSMLERKKVLILAPHTDDAELGAGGLISKALRLGADVRVLAFSCASESIPAGFPSDITKREFEGSMEYLGVKHYELFDFAVREFPRHRQEILQSLIDYRTRFSPDIVVTPSIHDCHQDHAVIAQESIRAFKTKTILMYEMPWNNLTLKANFFLALDAVDVENKIGSIQGYKSQISKGSIYLKVDFIQSLLRGNAARFGFDGYAEAYEVLRLVEGADDE
ncbi:PIG-L deacetylase family protein [Pseudidiomarina sediminum]|uniref:PIG-L deacetylase family protein n=1 Tax=Pseudidiomarina sediminum TaxID=431675 RepID=UPI001C9858E0|nr:PIG-L deacetylase family protein [Pseudidiomarina sediminum]MBY6063709.1 PIG-L family deacetylase [Pseudidiomarina sediminum]